MLPSFNNLISGGREVKRRCIPTLFDDSSPNWQKSRQNFFGTGASFSVVTSMSLSIKQNVTFQMTLSPLYFSAACSRSKGKTALICSFICVGVGCVDCRADICAITAVDGAITASDGRFAWYFRYSAAQPATTAVLPSPSKTHVYQDMCILKHRISAQGPESRASLSVLWVFVKRWKCDIWF